MFNLIVCKTVSIFRGNVFYRTMAIAFDNTVSVQCTVGLRCMSKRDVYP